MDDPRDNNLHHDEPLDNNPRDEEHLRALEIFHYVISGLLGVNIAIITWQFVGSMQQMQSFWGAVSIDSNASSLHNLLSLRWV